MQSYDNPEYTPATPLHRLSSARRAGVCCPSNRRSAATKARDTRHPLPTSMKPLYTSYTQLQLPQTAHLLCIPTSTQPLSRLCHSSCPSPATYPLRRTTVMYPYNFHLTKNTLPQVSSSTLPWWSSRPWAGWSGKGEPSRPGAATPAPAPGFGSAAAPPPTAVRV